MAPNSKTPETAASTPSLSADLEATFSAGLEQLNAGNLEAAAASFTLVQEKAAAAGLLNLGRAASTYLAGIQAREQEKVELARGSAELSAQVLLNRKDADGALEVLAKALQAEQNRPMLHYLKAIAHAQLEQAQEAADALGLAVKGEPELVYQFRLEPDFDAVRHAAAFAPLLRS